MWCGLGRCNHGVERQEGGGGKPVTVFLGCSLNRWLCPFSPLACHKSFLSPHFAIVFICFCFSLVCQFHLLYPYPLLYTRSPSHTPTTVRPNVNFWQELGSLFNCQCYCECPHKSNAVMPLKRLLGLTITRTQSLSHFLPLLLHAHFSTCTIAPTDVTCENEGFEVVCAHIRHSSSSVCLQFPLALVQSHHTWEFVDQHLLKKLLGVRLYNWTKTECNECNEVVIFMLFFTIWSIPSSS